MAIRVDEVFLEKVGLSGMPEDEKSAFIGLAQAELETRVGQGLGELLSDDELKEFESIADAREASTWLVRHAPTYREMTLRIFEDFQKELAEEREVILGK